MGRWRSAVIILAVLGSLTLVASACSGSSSKTASKGTSTTASTSSSSSTAPAAAPVTLTLEANSVLGAKNDAEAVWLTKTVIPGFEQKMAAQGQKVTVNFQGSGSPARTTPTSSPWI